MQTQSPPAAADPRERTRPLSASKVATALLKQMQRQVTDMRMERERMRRDMDRLRADLDRVTQEAERVQQTNAELARMVASLKGGTLASAKPWGPR